MASATGTPHTRMPGDGTSAGGVAERAGREYADTRETKPGFMTSEFLSAMIPAIGILIAALVADGFGAEEAWRYVTFLSMAYIISRGLAKSGVSRRSH